MRISDFDVEFRFSMLQPMMQGVCRQANRFARNVGCCAGRWRTWVAGIVFLLGVGWSSGAWAQQDSGTDFDASVDGSLEVTGETYAIRGIEARRPGASMQTHADLSFALLGLSSELSLLYSTESSGLRQSMNHLGFETGWAWGRVAAGTISPTLSTYSLDGVSVQGGHVELTPGLFHFSVLAGRSQRAVTSEGRDISDVDREAARSRHLLRGPAFSRWLYGTRIGVGEKEQTHFHLIGVLARDNPESLDDAGDALRPAESLSLTPDLGLALFDGRFTTEAQLTASLFTRDRRADTIDDLPVPGMLTALSPPRTSSRLGFAGKAEARVDLRAFDLDAQYERVEPGFRTLGTERIRSDQEAVRVRPQLRLLDRRLTLGGEYQVQRNNVLKTRTSTLWRNQTGLNGEMRFSRQFRLRTTARQLITENTPEEETADTEHLAYRQVMRMGTVAPTLVLQADQTTHTTTLSLSLQSLDDEHAGGQGNRPSAASNNVTTTLSYALALPSGLSANASANMAQNAAAMAETTVFGFNAGIGHPFFERKLQLSLNGGLSTTTTEQAMASGTTQQDPFVVEGQNVRSTTARQLTLNVDGTYQLADGSQLRLNIRGISNQGERAFQEFQASFGYEHQL